MSTAETTIRHANPEEPGRGWDLALWAGVLGAPAVWGLQFELGYALAPLTCKFGTLIPLHFLTISAIILALLALFFSHRQWRSAGGGSPDDIDGGMIGRRRFVGGLGMVVSLLFAILILAQGLASFFFNACWS